jgi:hypothetical protein
MILRICSGFSVTAAVSEPGRSPVMFAELAGLDPVLECAHTAAK